MFLFPVSSFHDPYEDEIELDPLLSPSEKLLSCLRHAVTKTGVTKAKKVAHLNAIVRVFQERDVVARETGREMEGMNNKEIMLW